MLTTYCFSLPGIRCAGCIRPVERALRTCHTLTIIDFSVDIASKQLMVIVKEDARQSLKVRELLHDLLDEVGVDLIDIDSSAETSAFRKILRSHWFLGLIGTLSGIALLILSLVSPALPSLVMMGIATASVLLTLLLGAESYKEAVKKLVKTRTLTMDTLFSLSTLTVMTVSIAAFFFPWLPKMFEAGLLIFGFRQVGLAIEESIKHTMKLGARFADRLPSTVRIVGQELIEEKLLVHVKRGDVMLIHPGEIIPVDGVCDTDESLILDTIVTGSTWPRPIKRGEALLAGMCLAEGGTPLRMSVTEPATTSYLARLDKHIEQANFEKAPLETATNKILQYFIPTVILIALASAAIISSVFSPALAIQCAASVLVSACPCTLGFITPLAVKIGMNKAAENGVPFKSAKTLQEAEQIDSVVFDLNGTLTHGIPTVRHHGVVGDADLSATDLLGYFALLERESSHPVARAIYQFVNERSVDSPTELEVTELDQSNHSGVKAKINGKQYILGNQEMMTEHGIDIPKLQAIDLKGGDSVVYLARGKKILGYVLLTDPLRQHACLVVDSLKRLGKQVYMCTGADEVTALRYARMLGIPAGHIRAACVGSSVESKYDKKAYIDDLKQQGRRVAMIGDAANDALAIAASDFGIAVKSRGGDEMTQDQAGAVIQSGSLLPVASAFAVAKQTVNNIKQNLLMSLGYNLASMMVAGGLLLSIGVALNPALGVVLMILQSTLILLNAYRFKQQPLKHLHTQEESRGNHQQSSYRILHSNMPMNQLNKSLDPVLEDRLENSVSLPESRDDINAWEPLSDSVVNDRW